MRPVTGRKADRTRTTAKNKRNKVIALSESRMAHAERQFPGVYDRDSARALFAVRALAQLLKDRANIWLAPFGINAAQHNFLTVLYFAPEGLAMSDLSALVYTTNSAVTPMVDVLEREGLVKRYVNPTDGRSFVAQLTRKGRALIDRSFPEHHRHIERGMTLLSNAERRTLANLLIKVGTSFETGFADDAPDVS